jgi:hypothetical protein
MSRVATRPSSRNKMEKVRNERVAKRRNDTDWSALDSSWAVLGGQITIV